MILTKVVATMGPACGDVETLVSLFEAGADVCRVNFSHGTLEGHLGTLRNIREAVVRGQGRGGGPVAILGDLCGPKIRLGKIKDVDGNGGITVSPGDTLIFQRGTVEGFVEAADPAEAVGAGRKIRVSSIYTHLVDDVKVGDRLLVEDGLLRFVVVEKNYNELRAQCTVGGILKSSKGINLPHTHVSIPAITERDWECVEWAIENDLDYLALSFVRRPEEILMLREHLRNKGSDIQIIAKIEMAEAVEHIDGILEVSDGLMVARGDLGVEMDLAQVPIIQKQLIRKCQSAGKPVIVATQMLQSMIEQASPTRAEVSDVANAIIDGTDAVMLSGETSVGRFPVGVVGIMGHIAETTEAYINKSTAPAYPKLTMKTMQLSSAMSRGVWQIVHDLKCKLVVIWSQTGAVARVFAKNRYPVPIVALSSDHRALRRMKLHYGVIPMEMEPPTGMTHLVQAVDALVRETKLAGLGDRVVIVAGGAMGTPSTLNGLVVHTIGEEAGRAETLGEMTGMIDERELPPVAGIAYTGEITDTGETSEEWQ